MSETRKLLILTSSYPSNMSDGRAAAGFFVKDFVNELSKRNDVTVVTQYTGDGPYEIIEDKYSVVRFPWLGKNRPLSTLSLPKDIFPILTVMSAGIISSIKQVKNNEVDHIIAMWAIPCGIWALVLKLIYNKPYSVWCLGADIWDYQSSYLTRSLLKLILKKASNVYADGFQLRDTIKKLAQIDCDFLPSSRYFETPKNQLKLKPLGVRHYLFVGRYHANKGPDLLIRAIHLLPQEIRTKIHFHFFGGGPLAYDLKNLVQELRIHDTVTIGDFIGQEELTETLNATDVVIIPSRKDSIPLMLSAALKMNKTIIATDVGDTGYMLKKYNAGNVVPDETPESLAKAIQADFLDPDPVSSEHIELLEILDLSNAVSGILENISHAR
jgi:glycosyltransferase involved in cell wall biosynthesis